MLRKILNIIVLVIVLIISYKIGESLIVKYVNLTNFSDFLILKKVDKQIIKEYVILDKYIYKNNKEFIIYSKNKDTKKLEKKKIKSITIKRQYIDTQTKKDTIYDIFIYKGSSFETRTDLMYTKQLDTILNNFNVGPYYDKEKNTLYIATHSSGKLFNLGLVFYKMKLGEALQFYDIKNDIMDDWKIVERKIVPANKFNNEVFLTFKNSIVLYTCYPFNSTKERLYLVLKKEK